VLSGSDETGSSSAIVRSCCIWAPGRGDCPVASSRLWDQRQRRPDDRKCWAGNVVRSVGVEWLTVNDVGWECLRLVYSSRPGTLGPCSTDSVHSDSQWHLSSRGGSATAEFLVLLQFHYRFSSNFTVFNRTLEKCVVFLAKSVHNSTIALPEMFRRCPSPCRPMACTPYS